MKESQLWEINTRLARVLPLMRDQAALSRLVQHVHPDAPADQVHLLVDDLRTLIERDLADLAAALFTARTALRAAQIEINTRHTCLACGTTPPTEHVTQRSSGTIYPRTGRITFDGPPLQFTRPDAVSKDLSP